MKITSLDIPASVCDTYGLKPVKMSRLENVVVIAGRNGAGKTRFLDLLKRVYNNHPGKTVDYYKGEMAKADYHIAEMTKQETYTASQNPAKKIMIGQSVSLNESLSLSSQCTIEPDYISNGIIPFLPKDTMLSDTYSLSQQQIKKNSAYLDRIGTDMIQQSVIPKIQIVTQNYIAATHPQSILPKDLKENYVKDYSRLSDIIKQFLNTSLGFDDSLNPTLFEKRIGAAQLSQGQTILLQLALVIYAQGNCA